MKSVAGWLALVVMLLLVVFIVKRLRRFLSGGLSRTISAGSQESDQPLHENLADTADDIAAASRISAVVAGVGAAIAAPAGIAVIGAKLGLVSTPLVVQLFPYFAAFAVGAAAISAAAKLYAKHRRRQLQNHGRGRAGSSSAA